MPERIPVSSLNGDGPVTDALAGGEPHEVGSFRFYFDDERWEWSPEVAEMHGYEPSPMTPTTAQVLAHRHADDHHEVATTLERIRRDRAAFSARYRIIDARGGMRHLIVAGDQLRGEDGTVIGTHGFYVDVTPSADAEQRRITDKIAEISASRAVIERAKGMLCLVYGVDEERAFALLRWRSQTTNSKLKLLAAQVIADFQEVSRDASPLRSTYDRLLLSAHERIGLP